MTVLPPVDALTRAIQKAFLSALARSACETVPYRHWLLDEVLPTHAAEMIVDLPIALPKGLVFSGRRETNNPSRNYFDQAARRNFPVVRAFTEAFQAAETIAAIERECDTQLAGTNLRVEYCQDTSGFWLEPHTDIGVKRFTMSLFLCRGEGGADMGTDIYDRDRNWFGRAPSEFNSAMIFIPSNDTFHGFAARAIPGVRKSLIVNYVGPEWRNRHELSFPETTVGRAM